MVRRESAPVLLEEFVADLLADSARFVVLTSGKEVGHIALVLGATVADCAQLWRLPANWAPQARAIRHTFNGSRSPSNDLSFLEHVRIEELTLPEESAFLTGEWRRSRRALMDTARSRKASVVSGC